MTCAPAAVNDTTTVSPGQRVGGTVGLATQLLGAPGAAGCGQTPVGCVVLSQPPGMLSARASWTIFGNVTPTAASRPSCLAPDDTDSQSFNNRPKSAMPKSSRVNRIAMM